MLQHITSPLSARTGATAGFVPPLLPTLVKEPPAGDGWVHEIKHDGYRTIVAVDAGRTIAFTRNGHDWSGPYRRVCEAAVRLRCRSVVLDGEMDVQGENGVSDFDALRADISSGGHGLILYAFDLLHLDGKDLRSAPLVDRRGLLRDLIKPNEHSPIHFSEGFNGSGAELFAAADGMGLEGIISKRASSRYRSGRSAAWLKTKCFTTGEYIVVGIGQEPNSPPVAFLASDGDGSLRYAGAAFIGLAADEREAFWDRVGLLIAERPLLPELWRRKAIWLRPELRVTVKHLKGSDGLRHASVQGCHPRLSPEPQPPGLSAAGGLPRASRARARK